MKSIMTHNTGNVAGCSRTNIALRSILVLLVLIASTSLLALPTAPQHETLFTLSFVDAPLKDVLAQIEKDSEYTFACKEGTNLNVAVTFTVQDEPIECVLAQALKDQNVSFVADGTQITLSPKESKAFRKSHLIKGTVTDSFGEPIVCASIQVKGTANGTVSGTKGEFELFVEGSVTLVISYADTRPVEMVAHPHQKLKIVLPVQ